MSDSIDTQIGTSQPEAPPAIPGFDIEGPLKLESGLWLGKRAKDGRAAVIKLVPVSSSSALEAALLHWSRVSDLARGGAAAVLVESLGCGRLGDARLWVATPHYPRGSLADLLEENGPLPQEQVLRFALQAARALHALHREGVVHGGIRPTKLLLASEQHVHLSDSNSDPQGEQQAFLAPEFDLGLARSSNGKPMDLYALGATLYTCLTGAPPPSGSPDLFELERRDILRPLQTLLDQLLDLDPRRRLADAGSLVSSLERMSGTGEETPSMVLSDPATESPGIGRCGSYELLGEIARGGMGIVFRARHAILGRCYAVKRLLFGAGASRVRIRRFMREARTLARLRHPGIVSIHEVDFADGAPYLVMDLVEGGSLAQRLATDGPMEPRKAAALVHRLASAVDYLHAEGVVHRDLKPGNILMEPHGQPRIGDFGLAADLESAEQLTQTGAVIGTLAYMAPEQVQGHNELVGPSCDIYALGAILFELLVGRPPFVGTQRMELAQRIIERGVEPPHRIQPSIPASLSAIVERALAKTPSGRYPNAAALAADLQRFLGGIPVLARPISRPERVLLWIRRHPTRFSVGVGLALLAGALLLALGSLSVRTRHEAALRAEKRGLEQLLDHPAEAQEALRTALELDPSLFAAQRAVGRLLLDDGKAAEALPFLQRAAELAADDEVQSLLGRAFAVLGDRRGAEQAFRLALRHGSSRPEDLLGLARILTEEAREPREALDLLDTVLQDAPQQAQALRLRLRCCVQLGRAASATADRWRLLAAVPDDPAALPAQVAAWLEQLDALSLSRGWQEVHRRVDARATRSLIRIRQSEEGALSAATGDASLATARRIQAALALSRFPKRRTEELLREVCETASSPALVEASWASRLSIAGPATFDGWVEHAVQADEHDAAFQALTLMEQWRGLPQYSSETLARLLSAEGWMLRASLALALAMVSALPEELGFDGSSLLMALQADEHARVRAAASRALRALAIIAGDGHLEQGLPSHLELALALQLARLPSGEQAARLAHCAEALERCQEASSDAGLHLLRARLDIEAGRWREGAVCAAQASEQAPKNLRAAALHALLQLVVEEDSTAFETLAARDPVAASRVAAFNQVARDCGVIPLEGPAGSTLLALDLRSSSEVELTRAFEVFRLGPEQRSSDGLHWSALTTLLSRFSLSEVFSIAVEATGTVSTAIDKAGFSKVGISSGWELRFDRREEMRGDRGALELPGTMHLWHDRLGVISTKGGMLVLRGRAQARDTVGQGMVVFSLRPFPTNVVQSLRLVGHLEPTLPRSAPSLARPQELVPLAGPIEPVSRGVQGVPLPTSMEVLFEQGVVLPVRGWWLSSSTDAPVFRIATVEGDFELWTSVGMETASQHYAGLAVTPTANSFDACRLDIHGSNGTSFHIPGVTLRVQGGDSWETALQEGPLPDNPYALVLRRTGDWLTGLAGPDFDHLVPLGPPVFFPLPDPVDLCLYTRGGNGARSAIFEGTRVFVDRR